MICPNCQHLNRNTAKICARCGAVLTTSSAIGMSPVLQGRYRILRELGRGGMGAVYLAEDRQLFGREWVVKEMLQPADPVEQREAEKNFQREAQVLASLRHPRVPAITHYFVESGKYYLVMELADGKSLEQLLEARGTALPEREVAQYAMQVCEVLEYLAGLNPPVVHRDIKPANIIVDAKGQVQLVDFGIARAKPVYGVATSRDTSIWGTPGYVPPEQRAGQTEPRSDVYALGATLHHLLTNCDPRDPQHQQFDRLDAQPFNVSPPLARLVEQMLNPNVADRPTATALRKKLEAILTVKPLPFPTGGAAYSIQELVELCDRHWVTALQYLRNQDIEKWLRGTGYPDLAAEAKRLRVGINRRKKTANPDQALDHLLHLLDPSRVQAQISVTPTQVNVVLAQGSDVSANVTVRSNGRFVSGAIEVEPSYYASTPSTFVCDAPKYSANLSIRFKPFGSGTGASRALIHFRARQMNATMVIHYATIAPLYFRSGTVIRDLRELGRASLQNWNDALHHFANGDVARWLQEWQRADLAAKAQPSGKRENAGRLAELLYLLDPSLPTPRTIVAPPRVDLGNIVKGATGKGTLTITNASDGILYGSLFSDSPFLKMNEPVMCPPRQSATVSINVDTKHLDGTASGQTYSGMLALVSNAPETVIPITWRVVHLPALRVNPSRVCLRVDPKKTTLFSLEVANAGGDILKGQARSAASWLRDVGGDAFSLMSGQKQIMEFAIDPTGLDNKRPNVGFIQTYSNGGESEIAVDARLPRRFPWRLLACLLAMAPFFAVICVLISLYSRIEPLGLMLLGSIGFVAGLLIATTIALMAHFSS